MFSIEDYNFDLPEELIAQKPADKRDESKLFHLNSREKFTEHLRFRDIAGHLSENDILVVNNTKVVPARIFGKKETGGRVEILILDYVDGLKEFNENGVFKCRCLVRASRRPKPGSRVYINENFYAEVVKLDGKYVELSFFSSNDVLKEIDNAGNLPLPPYIKRDENKNSSEDKLRYQTVYAKNKGAVAAPTAGLHFTDELMAEIRSRGVEIAEITLYVGYGTFSPVECDDIRDHDIHTEEYYIEKSQSEIINNAVKNGKRIVAVGTTSVRTLEYACDENGFVNSGSGKCNLYIYPGYKFKIIGGIITNFHLPKSTLIMLISAFAGHDTIMDAYEEAIENRYRFYSYGDSMFIE